MYKGCISSIFLVLENKIALINLIKGLFEEIVGFSLSEFGFVEVEDSLKGLLIMQEGKSFGELVFSFVFKLESLANFDF